MNQVIEQEREQFLQTFADRELNKNREAERQKLAKKMQALAVELEAKIQPAIKARDEAEKKMHKAATAALEAKQEYIHARYTFQSVQDSFQKRIGQIRNHLMTMPAPAIDAAIDRLERRIADVKSGTNLFSTANKLAEADQQIAPLKSAIRQLHALRLSANGDTEKRINEIFKNLPKKETNKWQIKL